MRLPEGWAIALIRIAIGLYFAVDAWGKTRQGWFGSGVALTGAVRANLRQTDGFYRPFLVHVVLPHALLFSQLTLLGEWTAGVLLLLGLFTGIGAAIIMWLMLNFMLMKGMSNGMGSIDRLFFGLSALLILASAGSALGFDRLVRERFGARRALHFGTGLIVADQSRNQGES